MPGNKWYHNLDNQHMLFLLMRLGVGWTAVLQVVGSAQVFFGSLTSAHVMMSVRAFRGVDRNWINPPVTIGSEWARSCPCYKLEPAT